MPKPKPTETRKLTYAEAALLEPLRPGGQGRCRTIDARVVLFKARIALDRQVEIFVRDERRTRLVGTALPNGQRTRSKIGRSKSVVPSTILIDHKPVRIKRLDESVELAVCRLA